MKIRTAADAKKLDEKIQRDLGIDVKKYRNPEVAEQFVELLIFPQYIINWGIRPIIISFFLYIAGFFIVDLVRF